MKAKERILAALNHKEPDKVPTFELSIDNIQICKYYGVKYAMQTMVKGLKVVQKLFLGNLKRMSRFSINLMSKSFIIKGELNNLAKLYTNIGLDLATVPLALFPAFFTKNGFVDEYARKMEFRRNETDGMYIDYYSGGFLNTFYFRSDSFIGMYIYFPGRPFL